MVSNFFRIWTSLPTLFLGVWVDAAKTSGTILLINQVSKFLYPLYRHKMRIYSPVLVPCCLRCNGNSWLIQWKKPHMPRSDNKEEQFCYTYWYFLISKVQKCTKHFLRTFFKWIYKISHLWTAGETLYCQISSKYNWGTYHLHRKTGNSSWKIKWFAPFHLGSCRNYGLWFEVMLFFYSFKSL